MLIKRLETQDEINGKAYVHFQAWQETYTGLIDQAFLDSRTLEEAQERALRAFNNQIATFIAKDGSKVVGFADCGKYRRDDSTDFGEVYAIYILKEYYGKRIGYSLMKKALDELADYKQIAVWVLEGNERAIRFYTRIGFAFDGEKYIRSLGADATELRMLLKR